MIDPFLNDEMRHEHIVDSRALEVTIRCPHCFGTGDRWHFDRIDSKHSKECIFCEGRGVLVVEVEREAA